MALRERIATPRAALGGTALAMSPRMKLSLLTAAAVLALLTGCSGNDTGATGSDVGTEKGVDYAWARPSPSGLHSQGYGFAARYLSWDTSGKNLSAGEADALRAAGVDVVVVWENSATATLSGYSQGVADAKQAEAEASADGMPAGRPIYFAIDFDAQASEQGTIDSYFDGVASVIGRGRTGAYGGYYVIQRLFNDGKIAYGWQTYAWSYGNWDSRAQLRQVQNDITAAGDSACCDEDVAVAGDFGQWGYKGAGAPSVNETAFQANTGDLWTVGTAGDTDWKLGMYKGTSPALAALTSGGFEVAFEANTTDLWTVGNAGNTDWKLGMMAGTSPAICGLAGGGFEVAFQANTGDLWTVGNAGDKDWKLGMLAGTSPSIACLPGGGFEVAFQANTTDLWTVGNAGDQDWKLGMMPGSSPSITALAGGGVEVAFEANTTDLWTVGSAGNKDWKLGMYKGTSPSIVGLPGGGFEVAFEANTTDLWTVGNAGDQDWKLGMMAGTSPSISVVNGAFQVAFEANTTDLWTVGSGGHGDWKLGMMSGTSPSGS